MWLENKNIHLNRSLKKLDQKRYGPFRISKDIGLEAFQLELPEGWIIHNVFNKDLLTRCKELQFKEQYNQHLHLQLLMKKRNMKLKKYRSTGNKAKGHSI